MAKIYQERKRVVISCTATFSPVNIQKYLEQKGYPVTILYNSSVGAQKDELLATCKCFIVCVDKDYPKHPFNLNMAYKRQIPIIPIILDKDDAYQTENPLLKHILERYNSSKRIVRMTDFQQAMKALLSHLDDIFDSAKSTPLEKFLRMFKPTQLESSVEPVRNVEFRI